MPTGPNFAWGIQRLIDAQQNFTRAGLPTYLRLRNFPDPQQTAAIQYGFTLTPVSGQTGVSDIQIFPQPSVSMVSLNNIAKSNGKLRFGARQFLISQTFVSAQMAIQGVTDPTLIWRGSNVVGLIYAGLVHDIVSSVHEETCGAIVSWILQCNANERR